MPVELLGLDQAVLSGGGVQHQQGLPVAAGQLPVHDAADLVQLVHQVLLVVQPPNSTRPAAIIKKQIFFFIVIYLLRKKK